jgi:hypothetical protein
LAIGLLLPAFVVEYKILAKIFDYTTTRKDLRAGLVDPVSSLAKLDVVFDLNQMQAP